MTSFFELDVSKALQKSQKSLKSVAMANYVYIISHFGQLTAQFSKNYLSL